MSRFNEALRRTLYYEGGLSNDPADKGGATYKGISQRFLDSIGDTRNPAELDDEDIADLYEDHFWLASQANYIQSDLIAFKLFDMSVNMGVSRAAKILQQAVNDAVGTAAVVMDGKVGPLTISYINHDIQDYVLIHEVRMAQDEFYSKLVANDMSQAKFTLGWARRAAW